MLWFWRPHFPLFAHRKFIDADGSSHRQLRSTQLEELDAVNYQISLKNG